MKQFEIKRTDLLIAILLLFLPISEFINWKPLSYLDELLGVICFIYLLYALFLGKLNRNEGCILILMFGIVFLGLLSNVFSGLVTNLFVIGVDVLEFLKAIVVFLGFHVYYKRYDVKELGYHLKGLAKAIIIAAFICAVISQFRDIGMTMRHADGNIYPEYGIQPFGFISRNGIQTYYLLSGCLLFIVAGEKKKTVKTAFIIMYFISTFLTAATLVWCGNLFLIIFCIYYRYRKQLKIEVILGIALIAVVVAFPAIQEYIFNTRAPRSVLLYYGFLTANTYFPFGSGFATYGGEMAARFYSPLYWAYGFDDRYGLSHTGYGGILNDNYVAMIAAQMGYMGLILFGVVYYRLFKLFDGKNLDRKIKPIIMSVFGVIVCSLMISANSKTLMGVWVHAIMGMCTATCIEKDKSTIYEAYEKDKCKSKYIISDAV